MMLSHWTPSAMLAIGFLASITGATSKFLYTPTAYAVGNAPQETSLVQASPNGPFILSPSSPVLTLDYGEDVAGIPYFQVESGSGQIAVKYSEPFDGLNSPYSDGLWDFVNDLMNTFRTETFNITGPGRVQASLLQGGQRWQSVTLLTNNTIAFSKIGFLPTVELNPVESLPGKFRSSNSNYSDIWDLGARVVQVACFDAGSQPASWNVTTDGALIPGQQPALCPHGFGQSNYSLSFMTKIVRGGVGWRVLSTDIRYGPYLVLTSNYPDQTKFLNTNHSLVPPNSLVVVNGSNLITQPNLPVSGVKQYPLSLTILEDVWHNITTVSTPSALEVYINGTLGASIPMHGSGTWGFGPFQDQLAYVKDVVVTASNGTVLYHNNFLSQDTLAEYAAQSNWGTVCADGGKRDRSVWIGDFAHTARTIAATTYRLDYIRGTLETALAWQLQSGEHSGIISTQAQLGADPANGPLLFPAPYRITDYQLFFLLTLGDYYRMTNDLGFLRQYWGQTLKLVSRMGSYIDPQSGLLGKSYDNKYFTASNKLNATAPSALMALSLRQLIPAAEALQDTASAASFAATYKGLSDAINSLLWNPEKGAYGISVSEPDDYSLFAMAFTIRAGIANETQVQAMVSSLESLWLGVGYKDATNSGNSTTTRMSPNSQGFLLEALLIANKTYGTPSLGPVSKLLRTFWPNMLNTSRYYSGSTWEYEYPDGSPGIGLFTSLAHPWGSAPTYLLTEYVLGIRAADPGYSKWYFEPLLEGLDLDSASGTLPTPYGEIVASWEVKNGTVRLSITAPPGTSGTIRARELVGEWVVNGVTHVLNGTYPVRGPGKVSLVGRM
ncbi:Six-hairpin glycosidase-like protein [Aspergillus parasiticus]|uniref:Six-hairpin glycosidase-like protein n=1 Tax=Aspergillus parasiticus TaxID=5067 RepID=A0A5N6DH44_ASPPA|nr:Six-hairpin glycosidase-like protein [Aspergillus parasiticus]